MSLRCDKCGAEPWAGSPAKAGGTHYAKRAHRFDASKGGKTPTIRYATCGTWVESAHAPEPGEDREP